MYVDQKALNYTILSTFSLQMRRRCKILVENINTNHLACRRYATAPVSYLRHVISTHLFFYQYLTPMGSALNSNTQK